MLCAFITISNSCISIKGMLDLCIMVGTVHSGCLRTRQKHTGGIVRVSNVWSIEFCNASISADLKCEVNSDGVKSALAQFIVAQAFPDNMAVKKIESCDKQNSVVCVPDDKV